MLPGECVGLNGTRCNCGLDLPLEVCQSAAGYYLGYWCPQCGPFSRETVYMAEEKAKEELERVNKYGWTKYERF